MLRARVAAVGRRIGDPAPNVLAGRRDLSVLVACCAADRAFLVLRARVAAVCRRVGNPAPSVLAGGGDLGVLVACCAADRAFLVLRARVAAVCRRVGNPAPSMFTGGGDLGVFVACCAADGAFLVLRARVAAVGRRVNLPLPVMCAAHSVVDARDHRSFILGAQLGTAGAAVILHRAGVLAVGRLNGVMVHPGVAFGGQGDFLGRGEGLAIRRGHRCGIGLVAVHKVGNGLAVRQGRRRVQRLRIVVRRAGHLNGRGEAVAARRPCPGTRGRLGVGVACCCTCLRHLKGLFFRVGRCIVSDRSGIDRVGVGKAGRAVRVRRHIHSGCDGVVTDVALKGRGRSEIDRIPIAPGRRGGVGVRCGAAGLGAVGTLVPVIVRVILQHGEAVCARRLVVGACDDGRLVSRAQLGTAGAAPVSDGAGVLAIGRRNGVMVHPGVAFGGQNDVLGRGEGLAVRRGRCCGIGLVAVHKVGNGLAVRQGRRRVQRLRIVVRRAGHAHARRVGVAVRRPCPGARGRLAVGVAGGGVNGLRRGDLIGRCGIAVIFFAAGAVPVFDVAVCGAARRVGGKMLQIGMVVGVIRAGIVCPGRGGGAHDAAAVRAGEIIDRLRAAGRRSRDISVVGKLHRIVVAVHGIGAAVIGVAELAGVAVDAVCAAAAGAGFGAASHGVCKPDADAVSAAVGALLIMQPRRNILIDAAGEVVAVGVADGVFFAQRAAAVGAFFIVDSCRRAGRSAFEVGSAVIARCPVVAVFGIRCAERRAAGAADRSSHTGCRRTGGADAVGFRRKRGGDGLVSCDVLIIRS